MLNQKEFYDYVTKHVLEYMKEGAGRRASIRRVSKNNQVSMYGLTIDDGTDCSPILYLEHFYEAYQRGDDIGELLYRIGSLYEEQRSQIFFEERVQRLMSFEKAKDYIFFRVINYEKNQAMLEDCPMEQVNDLAITYRVLIHQDEDGMTSTLIREEEMKRWKVKKEDIILQGRKNTPKLFPGVIRPLEEVIEDLVDDKEGGTSPLYIATNHSMINGASVMFYDDFLYQFAQLTKDNFIIIPSSIHEVLLLKDSDILETWDIERMVKETNQKIVDEDEVLSNHVYYYDRQEDKITIIN